jgi:succinyl-CoA:acetate CoA-transferase
MNSTRILDSRLFDRVMSADQAAALIGPGMTVAMSGFTGAGYPKTVPAALAERISSAHAHGQDFQISVMTGASTAPELDGVLARANGITMRLPYQSDPTLRDKINAGEME